MVGNQRFPPAASCLDRQTRQCVHVAYQVFGSGPVDLIIAPGFVSHVEACWDESGFARWLKQFGKNSRVITFNKRGTGLSDRVNGLPGLDQRMDDIRAVMDAAGSQRAALFGVSETKASKAAIEGSFT